MRRRGKQWTPVGRETVCIPLSEDAQRRKGIDDGPSQTDAAGLIEVAHRHGHITDLESKVNALEQELRIEHKVVAVAFEGDGFEHGASVGAEAAVPFAEILSGHDVFDEGESSVHEILDGGHVATKRLGTGTDAITQNDIADSQSKKSYCVRHYAGVVLIIGVEHDHIVRAAVECFPIASLLVGAVAAIAIVAEKCDRKPLSDAYRVVRAGIVADDDFVDVRAIQIVQCPLQRIGRVVGR